MTRPAFPSLAELAAALPGYDADALDVAQAQQLIAQGVHVIDETETVSLGDALGRVLAEEVISPIDVPAHDNSAMDGYAFDGAALGAAPLTLKPVGRAYAGHPHAGAVGRGECVRIMTGAVMPQGCDTVAPQELVQVSGERTGSTVRIPAATIKPGANRRRRGEDLAAGTPALRSGRLLRPADLGLLASLGIGETLVRRRLRVALLSTGDELRAIGQALHAGCVYDSNRHVLSALLARLCVDTIDLGVVGDDPQAIEAALRTGCERADVVLTSGGLAAGDADHTAPMIGRLGEALFWKLLLRPGRPFAFGRLTSGGRQAVLFGLPGNPVAAMISFQVFVRDALLRMMGTEPVPALPTQAVADELMRKRPGRVEYQRGILVRAADGTPRVRLTGAQGSGILRSMSEANCLVVLASERSDVQPGDIVEVLPTDS